MTNLATASSLRVASSVRKRRTALGVAAAILGTSLSTQALEFEFDDRDFRIDWDTNITYGAMWRVQSADSKAEANVNDGTNNFDTGIVSNKISVVSEADFQWGDYGFFVRGKALYDYRYENQDTDMSQSNYLTYNGAIPNGGNVKRGDFPDGTLDVLVVLIHTDAGITGIGEVTSQSYVCKACFDAPRSAARRHGSSRR